MYINGNGVYIMLTGGYSTTGVDWVSIMDTLTLGVSHGVVNQTVLNILVLLVACYVFSITCFIYSVNYQSLVRWLRAVFEGVLPSD